MIKTLNTVNRKGMYLNIIKSIYDKFTANITLNGRKLKAFPLRPGKKTRMPTLTTLVQHSIGNASQRN